MKNWHQYVKYNWSPMGKMLGVQGYLPDNLTEFYSLTVSLKKKLPPLILIFLRINSQFSVLSRINKVMSTRGSVICWLHKWQILFFSQWSSREIQEVGNSLRQGAVLNIINKSMHVLWLVNQLWVIVPVNSWKSHVSSELLYKSNRTEVSMVYRLIHHLGCWKNTQRIRKSLTCGS